MRGLAEREKEGRRSARMGGEGRRESSELGEGEDERGRGRGEIRFLE